MQYEDAERSGAAPAGGGVEYRLAQRLRQQEEGGNAGEAEQDHDDARVESRAEISKSNQRKRNCRAEERGPARDRIDALDAAIDPLARSQEDEVMRGAVEDAESRCRPEKIESYGSGKASPGRQAIGEQSQ